MTVAITGATGQLGRLTIAALKSRLPADQIVALARSPEKAADLGVTARAFDYSRPETLAAALAGVDKLLLSSSNEAGQRAGQHPQDQHAPAPGQPPQHIARRTFRRHQIA